MMKAKIIKTEADYQAALDRVERLMDAQPGSTDFEELELLTLLIEKYEDEHYPIDFPDPVEAIKFRMEQQGLSARDMIPYMGSQSKVSEVLNHKRSLSLAMIRSLSQGLGIPVEVLIQRPDPYYVQHGSDDSHLSAIESFTQLALAKRAQGTRAEHYRWNREEIYSERERRWLRDRGDD